MILLFLLLADLEPLGRFEDKALAEVSGLVASRRHEGIFWAINDSGNPPALYAVRRDGSLVARFVVGVPNVDWEELATDDDGHLFVGDIGNNEGRLPLRAIHRFDEPDPSRPSETPLKPTATSFYSFEPNRRFDAEGFYLVGDVAVLASKTRDKSEAELSTVTLDPPAPLLRPAKPKPIGRLPEFREPVTGLALHRNGRWLAACSPTAMRVYRRGEDGWLLRHAIAYSSREVESIAWDGDDLILASEDRRLWRVTVKAWRTSGERGR